MPSPLKMPAVHGRYPSWAHRGLGRPAPGSKKKKTEDNYNQLRKRHKNDNDDVLHSLPWSKVFEFLGGDDVVKALMASKHHNPWKASGNDPQQSVVLALRNRLMATDKGRQELAKEPPNFEHPFSLSKLLFSVDNGLYLRYDGVYFVKYRNQNFSYRFYPTGEVIVCQHFDAPELIWPKFRKEDGAFLGKSIAYQYDAWNRISNEEQFWGVTFSITEFTSTTMCSGRMGKDGTLIMGTDLFNSADNSREFGDSTHVFCPCES